MSIHLSESAVLRIRSLIGNEIEKGLRVKVVGGGCSGLQYRMDLDEPKGGDKIFERDGARVIVDRKSFLYVNETELDYVDTLMKAGFTLNNPNVKRTCGCGASFSV